MKRRAKKLDQRAHAKRRAEERYGVVVNRFAMRALVDDIQRGRATFLGKQSNRVTHWLVQLDGKPARAVYDKQRKTIVTFLPMEPRAGP